MGLAAPRLSVSEKLIASAAEVSQPATLTCSAQAFPVPQHK